jgi:antitoxin HicB
MAVSYSYSVILEPQEGGGFTVLVPALPEVVTEGETEQEALANVEEAIRAVLEYRQDPAVHIDIQIHISPESTAQQIDKIFESMAKHLYGRKDD